MKKSVFITTIKSFLVIIAVFGTLNLSAQINSKVSAATEVDQKYRLSTAGITIPQYFTKSWDDRTNTRHIELHLKRNLDAKHIIGLKFATWRLFQPMGILWWDDLLDKIDTESEFYPGHVKETGLGVTYQRMLWKGLFATVEVLPQFKTYLDEDENKVGDGFKLYNSFHLGYHFAFGKKKQFFLEPQVHSQFWILDTGTPEAFEALDDKWRNYFLFEPNMYLGIKF